MDNNVNNEIIDSGIDDINNLEGGSQEGVHTPVDNPEAVVEAVLFAMGNSVDLKKLADVLGMSVEETEAVISSMKDKYNADKDRGVTIVTLEGSVQMCSKTEMYEHLIKIATIPKRFVLTDAALETLSIVAYKQPVTRIEIEKIRGVNSDHAVNKLIEYGLIAELGRLDAPGRPLIFGTTEEFLRSFGVKSLEELPSIPQDRIDEFQKEADEEVNLNIPV